MMPMDKQALAISVLALLACVLSVVITRCTYRLVTGKSPPIRIEHSLRADQMERLVKSV